MINVTSKKVYDIPEFAKMMGISRPHAYRLVDRGDVPVISLGRRKVIPGWYVEKLLAEPQLHEDA